MQPPVHQDLLPRTAVYALRATACLASLPPEAWIPARLLARQTGMPAAFASKVLSRLVTAGIVEGKRGWKGGFRLARAPESVRIAQVLEAVDTGVHEDHCLFPNPRCDPSSPCPLHFVWEEAKRALIAWSQAHTLADAGPCEDAALGGGDGRG